MDKFFVTAPNPTTPVAGRDAKPSMANLHELLKEMSDKGASDLHITTGIPPMIRLHGHWRPSGRTRSARPRPRAWPTAS